MNNNILKNNEYAKFGYGIVLDSLPDIPEFHFFSPPDPIQLKCYRHISEIVECLERHSMSGLTS